MAYFGVFKGDNLIRSTVASTRPIAWSRALLMARKRDAGASTLSLLDEGFRVREVSEHIGKAAMLERQEMLRAKNAAFNAARYNAG